MQETRANLSLWNPLKDLAIRVCMLNSAGCGPWSEPLLVTAQDLIGELHNTGSFFTFFVFAKENGPLLVLGMS